MKWITPIIYVTVLIPLTALAVGIEALARSVGLIGEYKGFIDLPLFILFLLCIIVIGFPIFWKVNTFLQRFEKSGILNKMDHIRQSSLFYLLCAICFSSWIANGFGRSEANGYLLMWIGIAMVGILANYTFIFKKRRG